MHFHEHRERRLEVVLALVHAAKLQQRHDVLSLGDVLEVLAERVHRVIIHLVDHLLSLGMELHDVDALALILVRQLELATTLGVDEVELQRIRPRLPRVECCRELLTQ